MGFTRYWTRPRELDAARFAKFSAACAKACKKYRSQLVDYVFDANQVRFDAIPGCETFLIQRVSSDQDLDGEVFEFCKTRELPYDVAVQKCLRLFKEHFPQVSIPDPS